VSSDNYNLRKNIEVLESNNVDLGGNIRSLEIHNKDKEE
jgi:hypothetical protein